MSNQMDMERMEVTENDRKDFPHHTDWEIRGIKTIRAISDDIRAIPGDELKTLPDNAGKLEKLRTRFGEGTNPNWVLGQVVDELCNRGLMVEELYNKGLINEVRYDELNRASARGDTEEEK